MYFQLENFPLSYEAEEEEDENEIDPNIFLEVRTIIRYCHQLLLSTLILFSLACTPIHYLKLKCK